MDYVLRFENGNVSGGFRSNETPFATILKDIREDFNLSIEDVCDILKCVPFAYYSLEYGDNDIPIGYYLVAIHDLLDNLGLDEDEKDDFLGIV